MFRSISRHPGANLEASAAERRGRFVARLLVIAVALLAVSLSSWKHLSVREGNAAARSQPEPTEVVTAPVAETVLQRTERRIEEQAVKQPLIGATQRARQDDEAAADLLPEPAAA